MSAKRYGKLKKKSIVSLVVIMTLCVASFNYSYAAQRAETAVVMAALSGKSENAKIEALGSMITPYAVDADFAEVVPIVAKALRDKSLKVRDQSLQLLGVAILSSVDVQKTAIGLEPLVPQLEALLNDPNEGLRESTAGILAYTKSLSPQTEDRLLVMMERDTPAVADKATQVLIMKGKDREAIRAALSRQRESDDAERRQTGDDGLEMFISRE